MQNIRTLLKLLACITGIFCTIAGYALDSKVIEHQANLSIKELYHRLETMPNTSLSERINWFSIQFKGIKYLLGSLGEGPLARYDQFPGYRVDAFDCDTFVTTVLSLAMSNSLESFQHCLKLIRYKNGVVTHINRNHFMSIDWNPNNQQRGMLKDITLNIKDAQHKPVAQFARALINKSSWYAYKTSSSIRLQEENPLEQTKRLQELKMKTGNLENTLSIMPYIPFTVLFNKHNKPDLYLFSQIPNGAIVEIIRPNWDLKSRIGTALNVSHLGFAFWIKGQLFFRQASSDKGMVVDVPLIEYLQGAQKSPTIKGINVQIILPVRDCGASSP